MHKTVYLEYFEPFVVFLYSQTPLIKNKLNAEVEHLRKILVLVDWFDT